ncbi:hypothetical protein BJ742DRAFT_822287 [Cladochytrium replicatum]|nr:hypothetical protein BJ742DRAFT_822287 [Cladochytrium replicatum]
MLPTPAASAAPEQEADSSTSTMLEKPQVRIHAARSISSSSAPGPMINHYRPSDLSSVQTYRHSQLDNSHYRPAGVQPYPSFPSQSLPRLPQLQQTSSTELPPLPSFVPRAFAYNEPPQLQQFPLPAALLREPTAEFHPYYDPHKRPPPLSSFTDPPNGHSYEYRTMPPYRESRDLLPGSLYESGPPQRPPKHHLHQSNNQIDQDGLSVLAAAAAAHRHDEYSNPTDGANVLPPVKRARVQYSGAPVDMSSRRDMPPSPSRRAIYPDSRTALNTSSSSYPPLSNAYIPPKSTASAHSLASSNAHCSTVNTARCSSSEPTRAALLISPPPLRSASSSRRTSTAKTPNPENPLIATSSSDSMIVTRTGSETLDTSPEDEIDNPPNSSGRTADSAIRRFKNTEAARRSRLRKAQRLLHLENMVSNLESKNANLAFKISLLEAEKARWEEERHPKLRRRIAELENEIERGHRGLLVVAAGLRRSQSPATATSATDECVNRGKSSLCGCDDLGKDLPKPQNNSQRESGSDNVTFAKA